MLLLFNENLSSRLRAKPLKLNWRANIKNLCSLRLIGIIFYSHKEQLHLLKAAAFTSRNKENSVYHMTE